MGNYNGSFNENSAVEPIQSGSLVVTVSAHGNYSAKVQLGGSKLSFTGKLNLQLHGTNSINRKLAAPLAVQLRVGTNSTEMDQIFGQLTDNTWVATMTGAGLGSVR